MNKFNLGESNTLGFFSRSLEQCKFPIHQQPTSSYTSMLWYRRASIIISSLLLSSVVFAIIKKKQYKRNYVKIFMLICIFYIIALLSVVPHGSYLMDGYTSFPQNDNPQCITNYLNQLVVKMMEGSSGFLCGLQAFVNNSAYNICQFLSLLLAFYIRGERINVQQKSHWIQYRKIIIISIILIIITYLIPWIFMSFDIGYSYGPAGMLLYEKWFWEEGKQGSFAMFTCNFCVREEIFLAKFFAPFNMFFLPFPILLLQILAVYRNHKDRNVQINQFEPVKQQFKLKMRMNYFCLYMSFVQFINFFKYAISLDQKSIPLESLTLFLFIIFDLFPILLVVLYWKNYYAKINEICKQIKNKQLLGSSNVQ